METGGIDYKILFELAPEAIVVLDTRGRIINDLVIILETYLEGK
jgi:hypothetical protein